MRVYLKALVDPLRWVAGRSRSEAGKEWTVKGLTWERADFVVGGGGGGSFSCETGRSRAWLCWLCDELDRSRGWWLRGGEGSDCREDCEDPRRGGKTADGSSRCGPSAC